MEIEAKFNVSAADAFERLLAIRALGDYALGAGRVLEVHDSYLDTADRVILASGYSCRRREYDDGVLITLKGLRRGEGPIHRREELEVSLVGDDVPPSAWPESPVRELVLRLIGAAPLALLFDMHQTRHVRPVLAGDRPVAELSLDRVHLEMGRREQNSMELEVELRTGGAESDLLAIVTHLRKEWGLQPETRSKFEQALVFIGDEAQAERLLTPEERAQCARIAARSDLHGRRAAALLAVDGGASQLAAGQAAHMSERRVRHWVAGFRRLRMAVFPPRVLAPAVPAGATDDEPSPEEGAQPSLPGAPQPWPMDLLVDRFHVDRTHARAVSEAALTLFDHLQPVHRLPPRRRNLVEIAAQVHDLGLRSDPAHHNVVGHDLLLRHPPAGLNDEERQIVAFAALVHSRKVRTARVPKLAARFLASLPAETQAEGMAVAALVRIADGLDYSQGSTHIGRIEHKSNGASIDLLGPFAAVDAGRAADKSDLWEDCFGVPLTFRPATGPAELGPPAMTDGAVPPAPAPKPKKAGAPVAKKAGLSKEKRPEAPAAEPAPTATQELPEVAAEAPAQAPPKEAAVALEEVQAEAEAAAPLPAEPGLTPDDTMAEGARKTFLFHFERMLAHEAGTRLGEDVEELHDMRVATRRMRAALPLFEGYIDMRAMQPFLKGMRRTGRALGAVRDLDVFYEKTQVYLAGLPLERQSELDPLLAVWREQRERARTAMLDYLESDRYRRFVERFGAFLHTPGAGAVPAVSPAGEPVPHRLRHVVPGLVYRRLAEVRAYDEWMAEPGVPLARYHQLRIASKGLRYALEYFREVLAPEAKPLIDAVKDLQDLLGDAHDAVVACNLLRDYLTWGTWGHSPDQGEFTESIIVSPGSAAYLAYRQTELQSLLQRFPAVWAGFHSPRFGRWVADAVAVL